MAIRPRVLVTLHRNSCRTQLSEAFLRQLAGDELEIVSAGSEAAA
jgi:protein-tyrosine-phosphatase